MGLGFVSSEYLDNEDPDGGPTQILTEAPSILDKSVNVLPEAKACHELAVSLISLNEKTAATVDFPQSALADSGSAAISCGRGADNAVVLQDPRVSVHHFTIRVRCSSDDKENRFNPGDLELELMDESSNGTWVNDRPVGKGRRVLISTGDRIFVLPSAHVGGDSAIGYVVVALPFDSQKLRQQNGRTTMLPDPAAARHLASTIQCRLCEDAQIHALIHRCATVVPCGHNFCLGCMITWCKGSRTPECPACKGPIRQLVRNHSVDSIIDTFLRAHPQAARPPESLAKLDEIQCDSSNRDVISRFLNNSPVVLQEVANTQVRRPTPLTDRSTQEQVSQAPSQPHAEDARSRQPTRRARSQARSAACVVC